MQTVEILDRLVAFPSVSSRSNLDIAGWIADYLGAAGFEVLRLPDATGEKCGLLARLGPRVDGGLLLSAHMDVVPVEGQDWTSDPFRLSARGGRYYGRGTADMKGFLAATLAVAADAAAGPLARPLLLSLSYDEEVGCRGIPAMIPHVPAFCGRPALCLVGEPTRLDIATGHKGKVSGLVRCHGTAGHSALAPLHVNALHLAADMIGAMRAEQARLEDEGVRDAGHDIAYSTVHAGLMRGGRALNIVPDLAEIDFEIRHLAADDPGDILARLRAAGEALATDTRDPAARIEVEVVNAYPGLEADPGGVAVSALRAHLPDARLMKVAYGTEAGFFDALGIPTLVCGPGDMAQGHRPDEFIEADQLEGCERLLRGLADDLAHR
ncbi:acetylornithine deacetylase [Frigidibacter sp. RF13]|uniref:acetylornithine deacetylase n=1 Tax=Frigidibacter sp. RF13 TaxID=2997340 RepID=UPI00226E1224|nr:acetylornithine deacetylase [Frigidibacter sp. RF13]MCY1126252.1 acetylornithine deacetylase [Frigidibacter sp. RF13]